MSDTTRDDIPKYKEQIGSGLISFGNMACVVLAFGQALGVVTIMLMYFFAYAIMKE
jgi:hypothetical protein